MNNPAHAHIHISRRNILCGGLQATPSVLLNIFTLFYFVLIYFILFYLLFSFNYFSFLFYFCTYIFCLLLTTSAATPQMYVAHEKCLYEYAFRLWVDFCSFSWCRKEKTNFCCLCCCCWLHWQKVKWVLQVNCVERKIRWILSFNFFPFSSYNLHWYEYFCVVFFCFYIYS